MVECSPPLAWGASLVGPIFRGAGGPQRAGVSPMGASCRLALKDIVEPVAACSGVLGGPEWGLLYPVGLVHSDRCRCPLDSRCRVRPGGAGGE